jgi:hypothetical protein
MLSEKDVHVLNSLNHVRVRLVRDVKASGPLQGLLEVSDMDYLQKITTRMERESRDGYIKSNSLEIGYCSTMFPNPDMIRLVRFVSKIKVWVVE